MEKQVIQSVGFRNTKENGEVTGFQFKVRLPYYRGIFLSQLRLGNVIIDGEEIGPENVTWVVNEEEYTREEMSVDFHTHWNVTSPAVVKVKKPGGLSQGYHDLTYGFSFSSSYMPPIMQSEEALDPNKESMIFMPEFGHHQNSRRLIIV